MILQPLEPFRDQTVILSGLWSKSAEPPPGQTGADHWVAAAFLCANKPKKTTGADILRRHDDRSDHRAEDRPGNAACRRSSWPSKIREPTRATAAKAIAAPTRTRSRGRRPRSHCPWNSIRRSRSSACSATARTRQERAARRDQDRSILDSVTEKLARFKKDLGPGDRARLDEYEDRYSRDGAAARYRQESSRPGATDGVVVPPECPNRSTNTSSCSSICRPWRFRATSRVFPPSSTRAI